MIYEIPPEGASLRQGDIFVGLPRVDISLQRVPVVTQDDEQIEMTWDDVVRDGNRVTAILAVQPVVAIVVSQDCDATRAPDITLCEVRKFREVEKKCANTTAPAKWVDIITQQARLNQKWFYLPPDPQVGFQDKMGVDFYVTIRVPRQDLDGLRRLRRGRLNEIARAHFRERIAEFFRRYPYDEWYPLNAEEMTQYQKSHPDAEAYPWQTIAHLGDG